MLTGRQKVYLRGLAHRLEASTQIGKHGISEALVKQLDALLESHELIKITVLETCGLSPKEAALEITRLLDADLVQVIGRKLVLYRASADKHAIALP